MVMMVMMTAVRHYDEAGRVPAKAVMMMVMMMVVVLYKLDIFIR
jgi:hypothetical protein